MADVEQLPGECNIKIVQGDDLSLQFTAADNYSGYSFVATVHALHGGETTVQTALTASASSSTVAVTFPATTTAALAVTDSAEGSHNWKLVYTDLSNLTRTWIKGEFIVLTKI